MTFYAASLKTFLVGELLTVFLTYIKLYVNEYEKFLTVWGNKFALYLETVAKFSDISS